MAESKSSLMLAIWQLAMKTVSERYLSTQGWGCPEDQSLEALSGSQQLGIPLTHLTHLFGLQKFNRKPEVNLDIPYNLPSSGHPWIACWYHRSVWPRKVAAWPTRHFGTSLTDANSAIPRERSLAWGNKAASAMNPGKRDLNRNYLDGPMGEGSQHKHWSMDVNGYNCIILYRLSGESDTVPISQNEWDMIIWMLGMQEWIQGKYLTYEMINELNTIFQRRKLGWKEPSKLVTLFRTIRKHNFRLKHETTTWEKKEKTCKKHQVIFIFHVFQQQCSKNNHIFTIYSFT